MANQQTKTVKVQLVRSPIGTKSDHRATVPAWAFESSIASASFRTPPPFAE